MPNVREFIALDGLTVAEREGIEPANAMSSDQLCERRSALRVLEQAVKRLCDEYAADGKSVLYDQLKDFRPGRNGMLTYAEVSAALEITESAIKSAVHRLRLRHREILREEIAHTVARPEEMDEEIRYLLTLVSS